MTRRVYLFHQGQGLERSLLGNKGANLCEMTALGLPVPPGFIITTAACGEFFANHGRLPEGLMEECAEALAEMKGVMARGFGEAANPLLVSVRSGAAVSMPGMMDTVLNLGLNEEIAHGLARRTGNPRFANDSYRRFLQMYGEVVLGLDKGGFEQILQDHKHQHGYSTDPELSAEDWWEIIQRFKGFCQPPENPFTQLEQAIASVFSSWFGRRAVRYREIQHIPSDLGTAVTVQAMVFGNMGDHSGTGVAFTRNPATGVKEFYGEFLANAEGEDVVAGIRTPQPLAELQRLEPELYGQLFQIQHTLEQHSRDMQDLEFTIQEGQLYILQTRTGKRTAKASVKIAVDMVSEGLITRSEALLRIDPAMMDFFMHPMLDPLADRQVIARGLPASPGAATGRVVFSADEAERMAAGGEAVIMVRQETTPEDIHGMRAAQGILTSQGGMTSHAAVVARGMGTCCIAGCTEITVDSQQGRFTTASGLAVNRLDLITLDGSSGQVMLGEVPRLESGFDAHFQQILTWADAQRRMAVRANADTPQDARKALELGAQGIGLCRTEHMFFQEGRIDAMRALILAQEEAQRNTALNKLYEYQLVDMVDLFRTMAGHPVTIRLLDPPLHEFLPDSQEEITALAKRLRLPLKVVRGRITALREANPMMGLRGCRLAITRPEITRMQTRAILNAAGKVMKEGIVVLAEIMVPLISTATELAAVLRELNAAAAQVAAEQGRKIPFAIGTMMETPRACLCASNLASQVAFMSFGTNDLTQMVYGYSRDDIGKFLPLYRGQRILADDPFETLDSQGVGRLIQIAMEQTREAGGKIEFGLCGEHGGDARSIHFLEQLGLDYVSCSPFRVPAARIAAAQAAILAGRE